jgi:hypothetical protein
LCRILEVPVPKGVEFPRLNDAKAMEEFMKASVRRGLMAWAGIGVSVGALGWLSARLLR